MKFILAPVLILFSLTVFAQQNHFIYIQSDNQQAFYVKLNKKIMSSSANGYLIIPRLKGGSYDFAIGFPKNEWPEQNVTCSVETTDAGYLLKNFGEKGWGLFNFQTMNLLMADNKPKTDSSKINSDAFANTLSNVVNDPGIIKKEVVAEDTVAQTTVKTNPVEKIVVKKEPKLNTRNRPASPVTKKKNTISKLADTKIDDSVSMVYIDKRKGKTDTINVIIPADDVTIVSKPEKKMEEPPVVVTKPEEKIVPVVTDTVAVIIPEKKMEEIRLNEAPVMDTAVIRKQEENANNSLVKADKKTPRTKRKPSNTKADKKSKEQKTDIVKNDINEAKDSAVAIVTEMPVKPEPLVDTVKKTQPNNVEEIKTDSVKETPKTVEAPVKIETAVIDTVQQKSDAVVISKPVTPIVVPEKKQEPVTVITPKEKVEDNTNPNLARPVAACKTYADDDEYLSLRKRMDKSKKNENEMLFQAHKLFEKRCFNTKQIQRLTLLFATDQGKYKLLDDAYQYTYDLENFPALESELTDEYYKKRFRAMLR